MQRLLVGAVCSLAFVYLGICAALFLLQRRLLYFPRPSACDCDGVMVRLPVEGQRILVCSRPREGSRALIYFGGNAEDVSCNMPGFSAALPDRAIYLLNYRGYGGSSGKPSERSLFEDGLTLYDDVHAKHSEIEVIGRSLGSGIAAYVASCRPVSKLVLVTPYNSIRELAASEFRWFPVRWLLLDKYESWRFAPRVNSPTLIIAAEHDEVVPRASTDALRSHFKSGLASMIVLPNTGHNTISDSPEYLPLIKGPL